MSINDKAKDQGTVRLDGNLNDHLSDWLKTDYAKSLGFHSKSHFITNAVRELLFKYSVPNQTDVLRYENHYELFDNLLQKKIDVITNQLEHCLVCTNCESTKCDHVLHIWKIPHEVTHLKQLKYSNPFEHLFRK